MGIWDTVSDGDIPVFSVPQWFIQNHLKGYFDVDIMGWDNDIQLIYMVNSELKIMMSYFSI